MQNPRLQQGTAKRDGGRLIACTRPVAVDLTRAAKNGKCRQRRAHVFTRSFNFIDLRASGGGAAPSDLTRKSIRQAGPAESI